MIQCALCLCCATDPIMVPPLIGACLVTHDTVDTLIKHDCKDFKLTHMSIFESRGFKLQNGVAKG